MSLTRRKKLAQLKDSEHPFAMYVRILGKGKTGSRSLTEEEAYQAMSMILRCEVEDLQLGAFLMLLRVKEESADELTGFVRAVKDNVNAPSSIAVDLDWSSYAGKKRQLPWFLLSCFALADQGISIYMHGASGHTIGRLYTEDVLVQLGIPHAKNWKDVGAQLKEHHFSFMPLDYLCPELKRIIEFRNYLGLRSPVHTLSRLINPLSANYSLQSIFHPAYGESHQIAALQLNQPNAAVFKGEGGEIERKPEATCTVKYVRDGTMHEEQWERILSGRQTQQEQLNIHQLRHIWQGTETNDYATQSIISTMAIALRLLEKAETPQTAMALAQQYWQQRNIDRLPAG